MTDLVTQCKGYVCSKAVIGGTGMFFARVQGGLPSRWLVLKLAVVQLVWLGFAWAQPPATVTTMTITPATGQGSSVAPGTVVTLTAAVSMGGKPVIQGQVNFCDASVSYCTDVHLMGTAQLTGAGTAILRFVPGVGSHSYQAVFAGTANSAPSTSTVAVATVTGTYPTTTNLSASGVPGNYTLSAAVVSAGGTIPPTGTVGFIDTTNGNALLSTQALVPNSTNVNWNSLVEPFSNVYGAVVPGDFNGDGKTDLVYVVSGQTNQLAVLFGNGDGTFTAAQNSTSIGVNASELVVGDFNGDGRQDVAVSFYTQQTNNLTIYLGNGDGTFTPGATPAQEISVDNLAGGDFNGDGNEDLAVTDGLSLHILFGNGDGTFAVGPSTTATFMNFAVGDFNKDGQLDIVYAGHGLTILLGNGDGTFREGVTLPSTGYSYAPAVADFNGDGILDIADTNAVEDPDFLMDDGFVSVYLGAGDGSFTASASLTVQLGPRTIVVGDFNRDGKADIALTNFSSNSDSTFLGNGDGTFTAAGTLSTGGNAAETLVTADFNGDGAADLVTTYTTGLTAYLSQPTMTSVATASGVTVVGTGTHMVTANYPGSGPYEPSLSPPIGLTPLTDPNPVITVLDFVASPGSSGAYGQQVTLTATLSPYTAQGKTSDGETITFYSGRYPVGTATLQSGVATLQLGTLPVGINTLTAKYGGDETFVGSISGVREFSVGGPAPATTTSLNITADGQPVTTVAAGKAVTLTASVLVNGTPLISAGIFNFCDASAPYCADVHVLGTAQMTRAGTAAFKFVPGIGTHSYKAVFLPTSSYAASSSAAAALAVTGSFPTTTSLAASGDGSDYTLTATTTGYVDAIGAPSPTGTVTFVDMSNQNSTLATAVLGQGTPGIHVAPPIQVPAGSEPISVAAGDFNGDGIVDLAVGSDIDQTLTVLIGNGDGTFHQGVNPSIAGGGVAGDLNGDGITDLVVPQGYAPLKVLLGVGDGTFKVLTEPSISNAFYAAMGDFNGDGILDLAITTGQDNMLGVVPTVQVLLGNGDGTFAGGQVISNFGGGVGVPDPGPILVGDFNGDGKPDFAVSGTYLGIQAIFLGNGDGTFNRAAPSPIIQGLVAAADFNGDGKTDLVGGEGSETLTVFLSNGDGTFTPLPSSIPGSILAPAPIVADFNHDGFADIAAATTYGGPVVLFLGKGDGTLTQSAASFASPLYNPITADVNGDGLPDILVPNFTTANTVSVFLTQLTQTATATATGITLMGVNNQTVTAAYPGDTNYQGSTSGTATLISKPLPTGMVIDPKPPTSSTYGKPVTITGTLHPYVTPVHSSDGEIVTFTEAGYVVGTGVLSGGVASLTVSTLPVGTYYLIASFAGENYLAATSSNRRIYTVSAAAPTITFTIPNHTYGDAPFPVMATSNSSGAITYTVVSGPATIRGSTVSLIGTGTVTIQASQAASEDYLAATQQATFSVVGKAQTVAGVGLSAAPNPALVQTAVTFTAIVSSPISTPSGTVVFVDGGSPLGTGTLTNGVAAFTLTTLPAGQHSITAVYSGDANFAPLTSAAVVETVQDFQVTLGAGNPPAQTIQPGGTASYAFSFSPQGGSTFADAVSLTSTGLPPGAVASFSPQTIAAGAGSTNVTLTIQAPAQTALMKRKGERGRTLAEVAVACILLPFVRRRRFASRRFSLLCVGVLAAACCGGLLGCGGGQGSSATSSGQPGAQTYNITVTATSGHLSHITTVTLTVD
jgi:hypothetical protein